MTTIQSASSIEDVVQNYEKTLQCLSNLHKLEGLNPPSATAPTPSEKMQSLCKIKKIFTNAKTTFLRDIGKLLMKTGDTASLKKALAILEKRETTGEFAFQDEDFFMLNPSKVRASLKGRIKGLEFAVKEKAIVEVYKALEAKADTQVADNNFQKLKLNFSLMCYEDSGSLEDAKAIVKADASLDFKLASLESKEEKDSFKEFLALHKKHLTKAKAQVRIDEIQTKALAKVKEATYVTKDVAKALADVEKVTPLFDRYTTSETTEQDEKIKASLAVKLQELQERVAKLQDVDARSEGSKRPTSPVEIEKQSEALNVLTLADQVTNQHTTWEQSLKEASKEYILAYLDEEITLRETALDLDLTNDLLIKRLAHVQDVKTRVEAFDARAKRAIEKLGSDTIQNRPIAIFG